jgi:hypothetical protein
VTLNKTSLQFTFDEGYLEETLSKPVIIENKSNSAVIYSWITNNMGFEVEPMEASIDAESKVQAMVKFTPVNNSQKLAEDLLTLKVTNGESRHLKVKGEVFDVKV